MCVLLRLLAAGQNQRRRHCHLHHLVPKCYKLDEVHSLPDDKWQSLASGLALDVAAVLHHSDV